MLGCSPRGTIPLDTLPIIPPTGGGGASGGTGGGRVSRRGHFGGRHALDITARWEVSPKDTQQHTKLTAEALVMVNARGEDDIILEIIMSAVTQGLLQ